MSEPGTVGAIFEKPQGPVRLDSKGRWWINRESLGIDPGGRVNVLIGDGQHVTSIAATPAQLRNLAVAIEAQVEGAECNPREVVR